MAQPEWGWGVLEQGWEVLDSSTSSPLWWGLCHVLRAETTSERGVSTSPSFAIPAEPEKPCQPSSPAWGGHGESNLCSPHPPELLTGTTEGNCCQTPGQGSPSRRSSGGGGNPPRCAVPGMGQSC